MTCPVLSVATAPFPVAAFSSTPPVPSQMMSSNIQKVCLICGLGGGGIGDNVAKKFSSEGYKIAMLARTKYV